MSFGCSVGDFVVLASLAWKVYKDCKSASAEFLEVGNEVISLRTAIQELQDEAEESNSILTRAGSRRKRELESIMKNCTDVLRELQQLITRYRSLGTQQKRTWDRIKFGSEGVQQIRDKVMFHTSALTLFLTSLGTGSLGRIEKKLDELAAEIQKGQHEPSLSNICDEDNLAEQRNAWNLLMTELSEEFSKVEIESHKADIKSYIQGLIEGGKLNEEASPTVLATKHERSDEPLGLQPFTRGDPPIMRSFSTQLKLPPSPAIESDRASFYSVITKHTNIAADATAINGLDSSSKGESLDNVENASRLGPYSQHTPRVPFDHNTGSVGIDLSADYCRVAIFDEETQDAVVLENEQGNLSTPAFVAFTENEILVGEDAKAQAHTNIENTFFNFTLLLGSLFNDKITHVLIKTLCFQIANINDRPAVYVPCRQRHYSSEELTALLIKKMVRVAEVSLGQAISSVNLSSDSISRVISIEALHRAAQLIEVDVKSLLHSTLAAVMKYTCDCLRVSQHIQKMILSMNVRVDGCRCSIYQVSEGTIFPIGTLSSTYDKLSVDNYLAKLLSSNFWANHGNITEEPDSRGKMRLLRIAEATRQQLMTSKKVKVFLGSFHGTLDLDVYLRQSQLKTIIDKHVVPETVNCLKRLLSNLKISGKDINKVICFGETTRLPGVQETILSEAFRRDKIPEVVSLVDQLGNPALGSSIYYTCTSGRGPTGILTAIDIHYTDIALSTYTRDDQEIFSTILKLGSSIPAREVIDIGVAKQIDTGGLLLRFHDMGELQKYREPSVIFEIAVPFPVGMSVYNRNRRWQLGVISNKGSRLANIVISNEQSGTLIDIDRSPSGLLTVKSGYCVPITTHIRQSWHISNYSLSETSRAQSSSAVGEAELCSSNHSDKSMRRPSPRTLDIRKETPAPSPLPEKVSRRHPRSSCELRETAPPLSSPPGRSIRRRSSILNIKKASLPSPLPDKSFEQRSHSSRELCEKTTSPSFPTYVSSPRGSQSSRELRGAAPPPSPHQGKPTRRRSSSKVLDANRAALLSSPPPDKEFKKRSHGSRELREAASPLPTLPHRPAKRRSSRSVYDEVDKYRVLNNSRNKYLE